ncbi:MAG: DUF5683 domain-containing protein [Ignavibacteriaceae bacterium]
MLISINAQQSSLQENNNFNNFNNFKKDSAFAATKSPWGAVLRSAILPGLGQIYNESYIKAPIIWGIGGGLVAGWIWNNNRYWKYANLYATSGYSIDLYKRNRDFFRDQRDLFTIYMGLAYLLNLVDAYVDAQLFDFNVSEDFYIHQPMIGVKLKF